MELKTLVKTWFDKWNERDFHNLPVSETFRHTSPFGTIDGKKAYVNLVEEIVAYYHIGEIHEDRRLQRRHQGRTLIRGLPASLLFSPPASRIFDVTTAR